MSREAPTAVLQAAFSRLVDAHADVPKPANSAAAFTATRGFVGARAGYYFGTGPQGIGYYLDARQPQPASEANRPAPVKEAEPVEAERGQPVDAQELLREAEEQAGDQGQLHDARGLKRLVLAFEKKARDNLEARIKHADAPERFMDSEVDLDEAVRQLQAVASAPELYPELVRLGAVPEIVNLLGHENGDLAASVAELLRELTDTDAVEDSEEEARELVAAMVEANGLESLVLRLGNLDEGVAEEDAAVYNALSTLENMIELQPSVAAEVVRRTALLRWLLKRLKPREFDTNKEAAGSLLALLLQTHPPNAQSLADINGIDALLQVIAPYKNRNPSSDDETEHLENLFNALCCTLMSPATRTIFVEAEGVELMVLILKQKRAARAGALKALDFALTRNPAACERFVDHLGLRTLFSIFMGKSKVRRNKGEEAGEAEGEERVVSVVSSLMQGLARGSRRDRVAAKFVENEFEKCDRLMELYTRYERRVRTEEVRLAAMDAEEAEEAAEAGEDYVLLARMGAGLFTLQQCALIMGHLWFVGDLGVRKRILLLLHQQGLTLAGVRTVLKEFHDSIGDEGGAEDSGRARSRVMRLLTALGWEAPEEPPPPPEEPPPPPEAPSANGVPTESAANGEVEADEEADPFGLGALADDAMLAPSVPLPPLGIAEQPAKVGGATAGAAPEGSDPEAEERSGSRAQGPYAAEQLQGPEEKPVASDKAATRPARGQPEADVREDRTADGGEPRSRDKEEKKKGDGTDERRGGKDERRREKERHREGREGRGEKDRRGDREGRREHKSSSKAHKAERHGKDKERKRDRSNSGDEGRGKRERPR